MTTLQQLRERRADAWTQAQEFLARSQTTELSAEDEASWQRALADVDQIGTQIHSRETTEALERRFSEIDDQTRFVDASGSTERGRGAADEYRAAFDNWVRRGLSQLTPDEQTLLQNNFRAMQTDTGAAGGYTVPQGFWAKVTETMKYFGGVRQVAEVINTTTGSPLPWPTNDDTSNVGEILEEGSAMGEQDVAFGQKTLGVFTASSKVIRVSNLLLNDSGIDMESFLGRRIGERIGRIQNTRLTTGTGAQQPQGLITGATVGKTTASATAITYLEFIDLEHSVDAAYRQSGRCKYMWHDLVFAYIRKLKDDSGGAGVGRPLWQPSVTAGVPDTWNGYGYVINNDMDSTVASGKTTAAFGDFQAGYVLRTVDGGSMSRLTERYAEYLQTGFFGYERFDGLVQDPSAYKLLRQA